MTSASFLSGIIEGLAAPAIALRPTRIETKLDPLVLNGSYKPREEDEKNIRSYFIKAVQNVDKDAKAAK